MENNLELYEKVRSVPENAQKPFDNGSFKGTDISPMWRIKKLTEVFGPCGFGWYYEIISERSEQHLDTTMAIVDINLYVKMGGEWSKPIYGTGGNALVKSTSKGQKVSDEGYKMALTDALSVACKALGIGADVYWDKDVTKYTAQDGSQDAPQRKKASSEGKDTTKKENAPQSAQTTQIQAEELQAKRVEGIAHVVNGFADPAKIVEWAQKKYHKALYILTDAEYKDLIEGLKARVNSKKEGAANE